MLKKKKKKKKENVRVYLQIKMWLRYGTESKFNTNEIENKHTSSRKKNEKKNNH